MKHLLLALALAVPLASHAQSAGDYLFQKKSTSGPLAAVWVTPGAPPALFGTITGGNASSFTLGSGLALSGSTLSATGGAWGSITGTLADQTDLQTALDAKLTSATAASTYASLSGSYSNPSWISALAWSKLTGTPTTLAGYGITDGITASTVGATYAPLASPTFTGTLTLGNTTLTTTGISIANPLFPTRIFTFSAGGVGWSDVAGSGYYVTLNPSTPTGDRIVTFNPNGTLVSTADTGTVTNTMLAGSIALSKLATTGTASASTYLRGDGAWTSIDLSAYLTTATAASTYLPLAGGTLTGVLAHPAGSASAPSITGTDNDSGIYFSTANQIDFTTGGTRRWYIDSSGTLQGGASSIQLTGNMLGTYFYARGGRYAIGASDDVIMDRDAAARLQLGGDHATTATNQTIKAHDVTTGTGASLDLRGGNGSTAGGSVTISTSATTTPTVRMTIKASGVINMSGMPTSSAGLSSGDLWNNSGVVNIVP